MMLRFIFAVSLFLTSSLNIFAAEPKFTLIGGPTVLIEYQGLKFLTDPTFDPAPKEYQTRVLLKKTQSPSIPLSEIKNVDVILLSHDQHADNLDVLGRDLLKQSKLNLSTPEAAQRLGSHIVGMKPWETKTIRTPSGDDIVITATPARHGPENSEPIAGTVVGFVVTDKKSKTDLFYATGDTVFYDGLKEIAKRFNPKVIFAFAGAAQPEGAKHRFTMNAQEVLELSLAFPDSLIAPVHVDSWAHFREGLSEVEVMFSKHKRDAKLLLIDKK